MKHLVFTKCHFWRGDTHLDMQTTAEQSCSPCSWLPVLHAVIRNLLPFLFAELSSSYILEILMAERTSSYTFESLQSPTVVQAIRRGLQVTDTSTSMYTVPGDDGSAKFATLGAGPPPHRRHANLDRQDLAPAAVNRSSEERTNPPNLTMQSEERNMVGVGSK